jgi:hypothetical protein
VAFWFFQDQTGIPASLVTWQFNNENDGWPSEWIRRQEEAGFSTRSFLPKGWFALLGWVDGIDLPFRLENDDTLEVWWGGNEVGNPAELLDLLSEQEKDER